MASRLNRVTENVTNHYAHQCRAMDETYQGVKDYFRPMVNKALETSAHVYSIANNRAQDILKLAFVGTALYLTYQSTPDVVLRIPYLMCLIPDSLIYLPNITTVYATIKAAQYAFSRELYQNPAKELDTIIDSYRSLLSEENLLVNHEENKISLKYFENLTKAIVSKDVKKLFNWSSITGENKRVFNDFTACLKKDKENAVDGVCKISSETRHAAEAVITKLSSLKNERAGIRTNTYQEKSHHPHLNSIVRSLNKVNNSLLSGNGCTNSTRELTDVLDQYTQNFETIIPKAKDPKEIQANLLKLQEALASYTSTPKALRNKLPNSLRKKDLLSMMGTILKAVYPHLSKTSDEKAVIEELLDLDFQANKALIKSSDSSVEPVDFAKECLRHYGAAESVSTEALAFTMQKLEDVGEGFQKAFLMQLAKDHRKSRRSSSVKTKTAWSKANLFKLEWSKVNKSFESTLSSL
ncbi:hypothetical protein COB11_01185 [Candidatus Aerophobetes bacterium]|uniref:Uncharacterized protein n=1 Tax=Aerophobetes bacterium TaxID=2030807 RepID=A0A2A4YN63_UNCAE|nr:MAG: hypothetical protein COB11_01185 [Candidatus Aerophobetes bacterium]